MITIKKVEYILKESVGETTKDDVYKISTPWIKIKTSKGDIELPLSENYNNDYYSLHFRKFEEMSSGAKLHISYDFSED